MNALNGRAALLCLFAGALLLASACERQSTVTRLQAIADAAISPTAVGEKIDAELSPRLLRRFSALPKSPDGLNSDLIRLGRILYFEPLLSRTGTISCNTCHPLAQYGVTHARFSIGVDGKFGRRNAPTVYNSAGHFRQFWDGRAANLTEQALGPIGSATEMGMDEAAVKQVLSTIPSYREIFGRAFPLDAEPIRVGNVAVAIAEFERGLITPARWDRYLEGDTGALSQTEKEGAKLFAVRPFAGR